MHSETEPPSDRQLTQRRKGAKKGASAEPSRKPVTATVIIRNKPALHFLPVARLVATAKRYKCRIRLTIGDTVVDAEDILRLTELVVPFGTEVHIWALGSDAPTAVGALCTLIADKCGVPDRPKAS